MNIELKNEIRRQLPAGSIAIIAQKINKSRGHVSLVFRSSKYNDEEVIDEAMNIIDKIKTREKAIKEKLKQ